jgi:hypothetical protein
MDAEQSLIQMVDSGEITAAEAFKRKSESVKEYGGEISGAFLEALASRGLIDNSMIEEENIVSPVSGEEEMGGVDSTAGETHVLTAEDIAANGLEDVVEAGEEVVIPDAAAGEGEEAAPAVEE